jgi:hypothetical protein
MLRRSCRTSAFLRMMRPLLALAAGVEGDRDDDDRAGNRQLPEGRDIDDRQRILDDAEEQAPSTAPGTEPMPPAIEMPPMTQAAMTLSSKPRRYRHRRCIARDPEIAGRGPTAHRRWQRREAVRPDRCRHRRRHSGCRRRRRTSGRGWCGRRSSGRQRRCQRRGPAQQGQAEESESRGQRLEIAAHLIGIDPLGRC